MPSPVAICISSPNYRTWYANIAPWKVPGKHNKCTWIQPMPSNLEKLRQNMYAHDGHPNMSPREKRIDPSPDPEWSGMSYWTNHAPYTRPCIIQTQPTGFELVGWLGRWPRVGKLSSESHPPLGGQQHPRTTTLRS